MCHITICHLSVHTLGVLHRLSVVCMYLIAAFEHQHTVNDKSYAREKLYGL